MKNKSSVFNGLRGVSFKENLCQTMEIKTIVKGTVVASKQSYTHQREKEETVNQAEKRLFEEMRTGGRAYYDGKVQNGRVHLCLKGVHWEYRDGPEGYRKILALTFGDDNGKLICSLYLDRVTNIEVLRENGSGAAYAITNEDREGNISQHTITVDRASTDLTNAEDSPEDE